MAVGEQRDARGRPAGRSGRLKVRPMVMSGLALALGTSALALGAGPAAGAATATSTPGVTANSITVGSISDISAPIAGLFEGAKVGTQAYFAMINSQGGVNGRKLELNGMDSAFSSGTVANEAKNIAANDFAFVRFFAAGQRHRDAFRVFDDVVIGQNVALLIDDRA